MDSIVMMDTMVPVPEEDKKISWLPSSAANCALLSRTKTQKHTTAGIRQWSPT
jgi:hypothetical protein